MKGTSWKHRVKQYLIYRRSLGFKLIADEYHLSNFASMADRCKEIHLTIELATKWACASNKKTPITWARRIEVLRSFAKYCLRFDPNTEIPHRHLFGLAHRRLVPHIFTQFELIKLIAEAKYLTPLNGLRPATCRSIFGLLSSSGLRISEALNLKRKNVDIELGLLYIRDSKFHKNRIVPIHVTVINELKAYAKLRDRMVKSPINEYFFLNDNGKPVGQRIVRYALQSICAKLCWQTRGDYPHHRLHDLRHTFVVNSILELYQQEINVDDKIHTLSKYIGHAKVSDTYWYITGIPELMKIAASRFQGEF